jgi:hypothetical protein
MICAGGVGVDDRKLLLSFALWPTLETIPVARADDLAGRRSVVDGISNAPANRRLSRFRTPHPSPHAPRGPGHAEGLGDPLPRSGFLEEL